MNMKQSELSWVWGLASFTRLKDPFVGGHWPRVKSWPPWRPSHVTFDGRVGSRGGLILFLILITLLYNYEGRRF